MVLVFVDFIHGVYVIITTGFSFCVFKNNMLLLLLVLLVGGYVVVACCFGSKTSSSDSSLALLPKPKTNCMWFVDIY